MGEAGLDQVLLWSMLAGICTAIGAIMLFIKRRWSSASLAVFLGLASGVMVAVVVFDMLPSAVAYAGFGSTIKGVAGGFLIVYLFDRFAFEKLSQGDTLIGLGYLIMLGIAMHDLPEGMAIALGHEMKDRTGMVIALGIGVHNIPEGMAIAAPLIMGGVRRFRILIQTALIGLITPLGTILGREVVLKLSFMLPLMLGLASGIMLYLVLFQLWPQASVQNRHTRWYGFFLGMLIIFTATFI
jgi:ZIP family zinc transporter